MNEMLWRALGLGLVIIWPVYFLACKKIDLQPALRRLFLISAMATPAYVVLKGVISAIYIVDIVGVFLIYLALRRFSQLQSLARKCALTLFCLLIIMPLFGTLANYILVSSSTEQFSSRGMLGLGIWMYRNLLYFSIFVIAASYKSDMAKYKNFIKFFLMMNFAVVLIGAIDYSGLYDFSMYEFLLATVNPRASYHYTTTTFGWGFLGMFRGSVGQWFANTFLISIAASLMFKGLWRWFALLLALGSIGLIFCSLSRAGMVASMVGPIILMFFMGARGVRVLGPLLLIPLVLVPILKYDAITDRFNSIGSYASSKERNRVDGWGDAISHLSSDMLTFSIGNGATNRDGVAKLIGAYGAHNEYIDVFFRSGFFGFISMMVFIWQYWFSLLRIRRNAETSLDRIWLSIGPVILVQNCVIGIAQDHLYRDYSGFASGVIMYLLYGVFLSLPNSKKLINDKL